MKTLLLIGLTAFCALAQDAKKTPPATPPVLSDADLHSFWRAHDEAGSAQTKAQQTQAAFQAIVTELQKKCGDGATLQIGANGEPACVSKAPATDK